jgi:hypothetical protein
LENSLIDESGVEVSETDGLLSTEDLVRLFEESEQSTFTARGLSERDRDYVDNKQLTDDEVKVLKKRGQPPVIDNRIKTKIDYLVGLEKAQRIDPRALPRTPAHEDDANAASQALKYVADTQDYDAKRSAIWRNLLVEGAGGISVAVEPSRYQYGKFDIVLRRWAWDRMFWDPHSSEADFTDAGYLGGVIWMDYDDAVAMYPDNKDALEATMADRGNISDTYDDKPKYRLWADKKRKRVRICQIWLKRNEVWYFAEFTKGGILKAGRSPYVTDKGESDCEMIFGSAFVDRDGNRYGLVREMISLQDAINKRSSKSLHLLSVAQTMYETGSIPDIAEFQRERARPDGTMEVAPGALRDGSVKTDFNTELATAHFQLLQDAKNSIDLKGPNATQMGDKAQGSAPASGRAIIASQQGGMIQLGDLMDNLRHLDKRVFRAIWNRVRQFWTAEEWIRVTDDERNVKWVALNVDPAKVQMLQRMRPDLADKIQGAVRNVAELDCDIIIDEVPDSVTPALEQWQGLVDLAKAGVPIPPDVLVRSAPNLKNKDALLDQMNKPNPGQDLQMRGAMAKIADTEAAAGLKKAQTEKTLIEAHLAPAQLNGPVEQPQQQQDFQLPPEIQIAQGIADINATNAKAEHTQAQALRTRQEVALAPHEFARQVESDRRAAQAPAPQRKTA